MRAGLIGLALASTISAASAEDMAGHAQHHHGFYDQLRQPQTGISCCNDKDCRPAKWKVTKNGVAFQIGSKWIEAPMSSVIETETPDQGGHWCGVNEGSDYPTTFCAVIPRSGV